MANEFVAKHGLISRDNSQVLGTLTVTNGITASISGLHIGNTIGSASYANTASYVAGYNIDGQVSSSQYADFALTADTASFAWYSDSGSHARVADVALNVPLTASNAETASYAFTSSFLNGNGIVSQSILFSTASNPMFRQEGQVYWDYNAHTLAIIPDLTGSTLQVGQEQWMRAIAHEYIPNGNPVYVVDSIGELPCVGLAIADGLGLRYGVVGISTDNILSGSVGIITTQGQIHDLNTSAYTDGQGLFLSHLQSGSIIGYPPPDPYEKVLLGYAINPDISNGIIQVNVVGLPQPSYPYVGMSSVPSMSVDFTSTTGSVITIATGSVNLCTTANGTGKVKNYQLNSASFSITSSFIDAQYVVAEYNSGNPRYNLVTTRNVIDSIQNTLVFTVLNGASNIPVNSNWDSPGILLANKDYLRVQALRGVERESGCYLSTTASVNSAYIEITDGYAWQGVNRMTLPSVHSSASRFVLVAHSASVWSGSIITEVVYNRYDNGTNLATLGAGDFVVNWVYRTDVNTNATLVVLGRNYGTANNAIESQPPTLPIEMKDYSFLVGRIIARNAAAVANRIYQVDSAYTQTFLPAGITDHNLLNNLQGGQSGEYYHFNSASYAILNRGSSSFADTASLALELSRSDAVSYTFPYWLSGELTGSSNLSVVNDTQFHINRDVIPSPDPLAIPALTVNQPDNNNYNLVRGYGGLNNYLQLAIRNTSSANQASTDFIAEADDATESSSYVDFGIASSGYNYGGAPIVKPHDGYIFANNGNFLVGSYDASKVVRFFIGTDPTGSHNVVIDKDGLHASGSLIGTASFAITASNTPSASVANSASYIIPGAMVWTVSGSNGYTPAYLEPYDYSPIDQIYQPPYKAGRVFWDNRYNDWAWYAATGSGASSFRAHLGKEVMVGVHNPYSATLPRLSVVYVGTSSMAGQFKPDVYLAQADGTGTKSSILGVIRNDIPSGSDGFCLTNGVMHRTNMAAYNVGDKLWLSPTVEGGMTTTKPGQPNEQVLVGYCSEAGVLGSFICRQSTFPPPAQAFAGITSNIVIDNNNDGTITVSTGSVNLYPDSTGAGIITPYGLESKMFSVVTGSTNYVIAERSASVASYGLTTDAAYANGISIVRVATLDIYKPSESVDWDIHVFNVGIVGLALANRSNNKDILLYGYQRESGLTLYTTGSTGEFGITEGVIWYGPNSHVVPTFDTTVAGNYTYIFHRTGSGWHQHTSSVYLQGVYDGNGTQDINLTPCPPTSWSVNFVYRLIGTSDESAIVMSDNWYSSELEASNNATTPPNLPSTIRDIGMLVGRFVVQSGSYATTVVESAFTSLFIPAVVTDHEALLGLQGGGAGGGHWHLGADDYIGTGTGLVVRQTNPTMSNPQFMGATPGHVPYWSANGTLTLTGSVQVVDDQYVSINSASAQDPTNISTLLVRQLNSSSVNLIGAFSNVDNFSQLYLRNLSSGASASSDICATADAGDLYSNYIDMGIAGSGYTASIWPWTKALDGYVQVDGGDFWLATTKDKKLLFAFNNTASTNYADKTGFYLSGSWYGTASYADSASHALTADNADAISFVPAAAESASWVSASAYIVNADTASHVAGNHVFGPVTDAVNATSASHALGADIAYAISFVPVAATSASWVSASVRITTADTASFVTASNIRGVVTSASFATNAIYAQTASYAFTSSYEMEVEISSSWASASISASYALTADNANAISFVPSAAVSASWVSASAYIINSDTASYVLNAVSASYVPNLYPQTVQVSASWASESISSSYAVSASNAISTSYVPNLYPQVAQVTVPSASWVSASAFITTAQTASFVTASNVVGVVASASWAPMPAIPSTDSASWASSSISASYADNAGNAYAINFVPSAATSASWVSASVHITNADTASYLNAQIVSASWASASISASNAVTASYTFGVPAIKSGIAAGGSFAGNPKTITITFTKPFANNNYSVVVTGEPARTWTIQSKVSGSFIISANNNTAFANNVFWQAIYVGEYYS